MRMRNFFSLALGCLSIGLLASIASAEPPKDSKTASTPSSSSNKLMDEKFESELMTRVDRAMKAFEHPDLKEAVSFIVNKSEPQKAGASLLLEHLSGFQKKAAPFVGKHLGRAEILKDEVGGTSYRSLTIGDHFECGILAYQLTFYRTENEGWNFTKVECQMAENLVGHNPSIDPKIAEQPIEMVTGIVEEIAKGKFVAGYQELRENLASTIRSTLSPDVIDQHLKLQKHADIDGNTSTGKVELLKVEIYSPRLVRVHLVQRLKNNGDTYQFLLYKASNKWQISYYQFYNGDVNVNGVKAFVANKPTEANKTSSKR